MTDGDIDINKLWSQAAVVSIDKNTIESLPVLLEKSNFVTIEDLIPKDIFIESVFEVYDQECKRRQNCSISRDEISTKYPRVSALEKVFAKKFKAKKHKLQKMDIARCAARAMKKDINSGDKKWENAKLLVDAIDRRFSSFAQSPPH